jgi:hypothetical protein
MNPEPKLMSADLKLEALIWMVLGPLMIAFVIFFGFALIVLLPVAIVYGLVAIIVFLRTLNTGFMIQALMFSLLTVFILAAVFWPEVFGEVLIIVLGVGVLICLVWFILLLLTREFKWRHRDVLEAASRPVDEVRNGFTERPLPVGKYECDSKTLKGFARFMRKNLIALPIVDDDKTVFSINLSKFRLLFYNTDYSEDSWVAFDNEQNVIVNISSKDYRQYRDAYAFDQICANLGKLFLEFLEDYKKDQALRILDRLDRKY